jgi:hypothetical protein
MGGLEGFFENLKEGQTTEGDGGRGLGGGFDSGYSKIEVLFFYFGVFCGSDRC